MITPVDLFVAGAISLPILGLLGFLKRFGILYRISHTVNKTTTQNGGDIVADVLQAHGIKNIFTLCGGHISPILVACERLGIRVVDTRHEATAVFAADACARLTGTIGVAAVTAGPGVTNTVTAMKNAQMAESPVLLIGGAAATLLKGRGALQDIDQLSLFKPVCKHVVTVNRIREIAPTLRRAIQVAQSGTPGPVFVEFPINVLYPYGLVRRESGIKEGPIKGFMQKIINWYLINDLDDLFAGAFETRDLTPLPVSQPMPTPSQIQKSADLIRNARQPVILIGSQATLHPVPANELKAAVEKIGIPCFLGGMARGLLGRDSPLHIRQQRRDALKDADLVILAGLVCDFRLSYGRLLNRKSKIISVNRDKSQLFKNSDMFWSPTVAIQGDAGSFLVEISKQLSGYRCDEDWKKKLRNRDIEKNTKNLAASEQPTDKNLNPLKVLYDLEDIMSENSIIVADGGDFVGSAAYILRPRGPLRWLDPGAFGTLGVGGGFALGAKVTYPDSEVWVIYGDGSLGYSVAEFDTFTRHDLPVIAVVGNDAGWTQIEREQLPMFNSSVACTLAHCDYDNVANGYGGVGLLLDKTKENEIPQILRKAQEIAKNEKKSVLVNVLIGKTDFRKGSISV